MRLSRRVQLNPEVIDSSLQRLNCVSQDIVEVDIHPTVLSLLTTVAPDEVRRAVAELPPHSTFNNGRREEEQVDFSGAGINTAVAFSLHTVLLSRNRLTKTLGIVQFKNTVRLSLLGNRLQRIEDCEALSLLPSLQYLSLEFNPVTSLPHYRAHILRICSWPDSLQPKSCRLKKLDTRSVLPVEVERAAQCLQREKVTMGELVNRMRFLSLLIEAEKRIALHNEIRRRGFIIQDTLLQLTVENVVTRCSTQLLALVDVSAASHLVRRLMSGKCRLCSISDENSMINDENMYDNIMDDTHTETETSQLASTLSLSLSRPYTATLNNPKKATIAAFCKDWSRDVFRRAMTSLDHRICELLLSIAHSLGEELTVMDVDRLNKLWFTQVAKVDSCKFYEQDKYKKSTSKIEKLFFSPTKIETPSQKINKVSKIEKKEEEEEEEEEARDEDMMMVHIEVDSSHQNLNGMRVESETDIDVISLRNVSPISQRVVSDQRNLVPIKELHEFASAALEEDYISHNNHHQVKNNSFMPLKLEEVEERNSDRASLFLPREAPVPFPPPPPPPIKKKISEQEQINLLNHHIKQRIFLKWKSLLWKKQQENLCTKFIQQRLENLLLYSFPTSHAISSMMQMLPRIEKKRVIFRFWYEQARLSYAPRSFRLGQLLMRWRWRTYEKQNINLLTINRRARTLKNVWKRWCEALQNRTAHTNCDSIINHTNIIEKNTNSVPQYSLLLHSGCVGNPSLSGKILSKETRVSFEEWSESKGATDVTQGLTCSTKPSAEAVGEIRILQQVEQTPGVAACLSLPMVTPIAETSPPIRMPLLCEKATQTMALPSYDDLAAEYKAAILAEADEAVAAIQADRLRLVDRVITLEQRVNEECVRVKHREEEIENLKEKLAAMTIREECMKSGLEDYNREIEHLRAVVQALREERRELLRPLVR
ncbi:uncharacterized protein TM35_000016260 [Trypanosoma theileri]|uniref:Uncharacterized protein n=1 Tax=Trypanosoma theileri TaxID=67003 RepID=A0A1X0PAZ1_9TRYP|nr:uncharacterized protein TM35_000016260 [Trypanosoma theileri]ORC93749.1 hypothetical protein TM35_000016260 [Trypanosoma theileri]